MADARHYNRRGLMELTPRQREVHRCAVAGMSNSAIGKTLNININTVKHHLGIVFEKFQVSNRWELVTASAEIKASHYIRAFRCGACGDLLEAEDETPAQFRVKCRAEDMAFDLPRVCFNCSQKLRSVIEAALAELKRTPSSVPWSPDLAQQPPLGQHSLDPAGLGAGPTGDGPEQ